MRIIVSGDQISFFERFGFVELESFFSDRQVADLLAAATDEIGRRYKGRPGSSFDDRILLHGYDIAVSSAKVRKELLTTGLAQAAFSLIRIKPLRYAFDLFWKLPGITVSTPLSSISSVFPLLGSVVIALEDNEGGGGKPCTPFEYSSFPQKKGNIAFLASNTVIRTDQSSTGTYFILGITSANPMYQFQAEDRHTHFLKPFGYVFGDQLKEATHPTMFR